MPCYNPVRASRSETEFTSTGKRAVLFGDESGLNPFHLPCGQCIGCRLERSRQWAIRCMHEASLHDSNCFVTLTINEDQSLRRRTTLDKSDPQKFLKRLRHHFPKIRYYYCGEYGENYGRPHYHFLFFGLDFSDKKPFRRRNGFTIYRSALLESLWPFGFSEIGSVTFESAAYVARYVTKKRFGKDADEFYSGRLPEYTNMSLKPAIGLPWIEKFHPEVFRNDSVILRGKEVRPPRYYDKFYEKNFSSEFDALKIRREDLSFEFEISEEASPLRRLVRHELVLRRHESTSRSYESDFPNSSTFDWSIVNYYKGVLNV